MNDFLTFKDIALTYNVSVRSLHRHIRKLTNGMTKTVKHNGVIVIKKEGRAWAVKRDYLEQFYTKRTKDTPKPKQDKDNANTMPNNDMAKDIIIKDLRERIDYLVNEIEQKNKHIERLENRFDDKENDSRVLLSKLVEMQSKLIEAPKKRKGWFR